MLRNNIRYGRRNKGKKDTYNALCYTQQISQVLHVHSKQSALQFQGLSYQQSSAIAHQPSTISVRVPLYLPIHPRSESFIVISSKADIQHRRTMFVLLNYLSTGLLVLRVVEIDIAIPGGNQQSMRGVWCEFEGRNRVGGRGGKLVLYCFNRVSYVRL